MTNPVSYSDLAAALDALILDTVLPPLADDDITVTRLAERGVSESTARRLLERWTKAGKVEYIGERRDVSGHKVKAWRLK